MVESAVTSKGQTTLPKVVREALGVVPGDHVRYVIFDNNEVRLIPVRRGGASFSDRMLAAASRRSGADTLYTFDRRAAQLRGAALLAKAQS